MSIAVVSLKGRILQHDHSTICLTYSETGDNENNSVQTMVHIFMMYTNYKKKVLPIFSKSEFINMPSTKADQSNSAISPSATISNM